MPEDRKPYAHSDRCVTCGRSEAAHKDNPAAYCKAFGTLNLPEGKTCGDCAHIRRCEAIFGHIPADQTCDWFPIRYREAAQPAAVMA